jgi:hypothetical protein
MQRGPEIPTLPNCTLRQRFNEPAYRLDFRCLQGVEHHQPPDVYARG